MAAERALTKFKAFHNETTHQNKNKGNYSRNKIICEKSIRALYLMLKLNICI